LGTVTGQPFEQISISGRFTILAIDHGSIPRPTPDPGSRLNRDEEILSAKLSVVETLAADCSAVLADVALAQHSSFLSLPQRQHRGLILSVDESDYGAPTPPPPTVPDLALLERLCNLGAAAAKVVVYYDRRSADAAERRERVSSIVSACTNVGLPLLVEPLPLVDEFGPKWVVAEMAADMAACGAGIVKLPLPDEAEEELLAASEKTTAALGTIPWILLSSGSAFPNFVEKLEIAMSGGAAGFAAGRSLWDALIVRPSEPQAKLEAKRRLKQAVTVVERFPGSRLQ
jgi:sulfofructosephosphate aldolase